MCRNSDVFYFVCCCCAIKRASTPSEFLIELEQISHLSRTLEPMLSSFGSPFSVYFPPAARSAFWRENCFSFHFTSLDPRWTAMKKWERQIPTKFRALTRKNADEAWSYVNVFTITTLPSLHSSFSSALGSSRTLLLLLRWDFSGRPTRSLCVCLFISRLWKQ